MKLRLTYFMVFLTFLFSHSLNAQKTLPNFSIKAVSKGKVLISWFNPHKNCIKLSVQRSSNHETFQTLIWARNPNLYENEYVDKTASPDSNWQYRIFYVLKGGKYFFSNTLNSTGSSTTKPYLSNLDYKPSKIVYSNQKNNIVIQLPDAKQQNYRIIFYDENGIELFQLNQIKDTELYVDKSNFMHVGWFGYEVYRGDKIVEKNKILVKSNFIP